MNTKLMAVHYSSDFMEQIYADNAATTKLSQDAFSAMVPYYHEFFGNPSSRHYLSREPRNAVSRSSDIISNCINSKSSEIYYTSGGTESDNWALRGLINSVKNHIITSSIEHSAILNTCKFLEKDGVDVTYLDVDSNGFIDYDELNSSITNHTAVVSIMHGNNEVGCLQDLSSISKIVHSHGSYFHTDAVQTIGHIPIDVNKLGIDLLSASAHKFNGPRGIGFLYVREGVSIDPLIFGGGQQSGLRSGTLNVPAIVGMAAALENNCKNIENNMSYLTKLENSFHELFKTSNLDFRYNCNSESKIPGLISISFKDVFAESIVDILSMKGVCISAGSACNSHTTEVSHVLKSMNVDERYAKGTVRISLGICNTPDDINKICKTLIQTVCSLKNLSKRIITRLL